jgi:hypothetical protein
MTYSYFAYGLAVQSSISLPELVGSAVCEPDVTVRLGKVGRPLPAITNRGSGFHMTAQEAVLFWEDVGTFLVRGGKEIIVEPAERAEERLVRLPILGAVFAVLLHQRGFLVLHASAVAVDGKAIAFLGAKGSGKSTTAATFYARGHELLADDVVALDLSGMLPPIALSGFPQFKLWPEAAASLLGDDPEVLPPLCSGYEKRSRRVVDRFSENPLPLRGVYAISEGPDLQIKRLAPQHAILALIGNSYVARFGKQLLNGTGASSHLHQCTSLVNTIPVYSLERPNSLPSLPAVAQLVEEQLGRDAVRS